MPATPLAKELPTPAELVESSFQFAERLLAAQHEFAKDVLAAAAPVMKKTAAGNGSESAPKAS